MTRTSGNPRADVSAWDADILRLTAFCPPGTPINGEGWWASVTGAEPDGVTEKPKAGERVEVGRHEGWPLALQIQSREGRIDWVSGAFGESIENPETASLPQRVSSFVTLMKRWLREMSPPVSRLAFGAILMLDVKGVQEGYKKLSDYLNFNLDAGASSDFHYQINRRRESKTLPPVPINRLMEWSVSSLHQKRLIVSAGADYAAGDVTPPRFFLRAELDINTATPEAGPPLPKDKLPDLLDELVGLAQEIVREGDIP